VAGLDGRIRLAAVRFDGGHNPARAGGVYPGIPGGRRIGGLADALSRSWGVRGDTGTEDAAGRSASAAPTAR